MKSLSVFCGFLLVAALSNSDSLKAEPEKQRPNTYKISGVITEQTYLDFKKALEQDKNIRGIYLNSIGGHVKYAIKIGRLIHEHKLATRVPREAKCMSACIYPLLAGVHVSMAVPIGIHATSYFGESYDQCSNFECRFSLKITLDAERKYFKEIGYDPSLVDFMEATPPQSMNYITDKEIIPYKL